MPYLECGSHYAPLKALHSLRMSCEPHCWAHPEMERGADNRLADRLRASFVPHLPHLRGETQDEYRRKRLSLLSWRVKPMHPGIHNCPYVRSGGKHCNRRRITMRVEYPEMSNMTITVSSLAGLADARARVDQCGVLSLLAPRVNNTERFPIVSAFEHLQIEIDDISRDQDAPFAPNREHAIAIVNFGILMRQQNIPVIVHCMSGVSRSTAAAIGLLYLKNRLSTKWRPQDFQTAVDDLASARRDWVGSFRPNALLLAHLDEHMNAGGILLRAGLKHHPGSVCDPLS